MPPRTYSPATREALRLLGTQIAAARRERRWTAADLAERAGITTVTLRRVEHGQPGVAIGTAFEVATLVGVPLFVPDSDLASLAGARARAADQLALLPARVRERAGDDRDDF
ncbi:helix-turn-helix transcriptional regulator [Luteimicrobium subarcticum]|uniref:Xre family transcriptional regulator n=1 Tax=Luteimicrobium subarcticum TaxID=620910 RepID=A0A2M8WRB9_9MICO|nr:helix-turn-helix transcriptional regulator [Luteimicrobium subarcticum]PJI93444.1 Xre family transcriptional regulator [Luteimicrobium subarcticum]